MDYDIKITGGTIIDGTGAPGYPGDLGIARGGSSRSAMPRGGRNR